jgi:hypothetical protein
MRLYLIAILAIAPGLWGADSFSETVYPVLESAACRSCHNHDGVASATRLIFPAEDAPAANLEAFGKSLVALVDRAKPEESLLFRKPTQRIPHTGGQRIKQGSADEKVLLSWVNTLARLTGDELTQALSYKPHVAGAGGPVVELRRLSHSQYNNTVHDLLGDLTSPANRFPPEDFVNGFKNQYLAQNLSPLLVEAYAAAAEKLAQNAFRRGDVNNLLGGCKPSAECRSKFVRTFGMKAFRRPLEPGEQKRYEALFAAEKDFLKGAQLVVEAMLQASSFLFRLDQASDPKWKPYAAASRLSYALWDSMPDDSLFEAAARGELNTPQGVEKVARRMLESPKARRAIDEFTAQWLRYDRILTATRDRRRFPQFNLELAISMTQEARQFISHLVWNDRNFMEIYTSDYGFANADLAAIYGVSAPLKDFEPVKFPVESERAGLLGQALFLSLTAKPDDTSPTGRGLFVREQFLCQEVPPPLPGVDTNLPPASEAKPLSNRGRMSEHATSPVCASCHSLIDPIGFGLEKFDPIGARREVLKLQFGGGRRGGGNRQGPPPKVVEVPLDTTGVLAGVPDSKFSSPRELGAVLAKTPQCQECVVKQYFRFTSGRMETLAEHALIRRVTEEFRKSGFKFREMMIALVREREFPSGPEGSQNVARNH